MRKLVALCIWMLALFAAISLAYAADTNVSVYGQIVINDLPAGPNEEALFTVELLDSDMLPVIDETGVPVQAVNSADGSFVVKTKTDLSEEKSFYLREIYDAGLAQTYILDIEPHPVTVASDGNGGFVASPDPVMIRNRTRTSLTVHQRWEGPEPAPDGITPALYADGVLQKNRIPIRNENTYTFADLPLTDENGKRITWSAKGQPPAGCSVLYSNTGEWSSRTDAAYDQGVILIFRSVKAVIYIEWRGTSNPPNSVTLDIYRDGKMFLSQKETPQRDGSISFLLHEYNQNGEKSVYSFVERPISGYNTRYSNPAPYENERGKVYDGGKIINTLEWNPPPTGDAFPLAPLVLLGFSLLILFIRRRNAG